MDPIFSALPDVQLRMIEDSLANDEVSSNEELLEFFIDEGVLEEAAKQALIYRDQYLTEIFQAGLTPIRQGNNAHRYDPYARRFTTA